MHYRAVEIKDGESIEPVNYVGMHPIRWSQGGAPTVGFVEDDTIADLLTACESLRDYVVNEVFASGGETVPQVVQAAAAIAKARGEGE